MTFSRLKIVALALSLAGPALAQGANPTLKPSSGGTGLFALGSGVASALGSTAGTNGGFALFAQLGAGAFASAYTLPAATATVLGGVMPDGTTIRNISGAISVAYGTTANTAAQGNDARITGAAQTANNLNDLSSAPAARNSLGLGSAAVAATGTAGATLCFLNANCTVSGSWTFPNGAITASMLASGAAAANLGFAFPFVGLNSSNGATDFSDLSGGRQFEIYPFPGAVNYFSVEGNLAGGAPTLFSQGSDANIDANIAAKGTGLVTMGNGLGVLAQFGNYNGLSSSAWPLLQAVQGGTAIYSAGGYGSNISINILPIGTGGFSAGPAQTVTGTNAVALGSSNKASGYASVALGIASYAQGAYSLSTGAYSFDNSVVGKRSHSSAHLGSARGTTQISEQVFAIQTTTATPATATSDGGGASVNNTIQLQPNYSVGSRIMVVARDTSTGATAMWKIDAFWQEGATASTATLVYSSGTGAPIGSTGTGALSWTVTLGTNTTTGYGYVICTGAASQTVRWVVRVDNVEDMNG